MIQIIETVKSYYLITEFASGGELINIVTEKRKIEEAEASYYFVQLISGLDYIHKNTVVQR
jgi:5'-AMP-activated protein kinase catalytic alpha subunit